MMFQRQPLTVAILAASLGLVACNSNDHPPQQRRLQSQLRLHWVKFSVVVLFYVMPKLAWT